MATWNLISDALNAEASPSGTQPGTDEESTTTPRSRPRPENGTGSDPPPEAVSGEHGPPGDSGSDPAAGRSPAPFHQETLNHCDTDEK